MSVTGAVESVWRYPVKSMRGERAPSSASPAYTATVFSPFAIPKPTSDSHS